MSDKLNDKPFDIFYVLGLTTRRLLRHVDKSINITFSRTKDGTLPPEKVAEAFETLSVLHQLRAQIDEYKPKRNKGTKNGGRKRD